MLSAHKKSQARMRPGSLLLIPLVVLGLTSCAKIDPRQVDVDLPADIPVVTETNFDQPLADLGKMTQVYGKRVLIQGKDIVDFTGDKLSISEIVFSTTTRDRESNNVEQTVHD